MRQRIGYIVLDMGEDKVLVHECLEFAPGVGGFLMPPYFVEATRHMQVLREAKEKGYVIEHSIEDGASECPDNVLATITLFPQGWDRELVLAQFDIVVGEWGAYLKGQGG